MACSLTEEQLEMVARLIEKRVSSRKDISASLGITEAALKAMLERYRNKQKRIRAMLQLPPRPFVVPLQQEAQITPSHVTKAVVIGDRHVPFDDAAAFEIALTLIKDVKPDVVVDMGDATDCWQISDYDKDPTRRNSLQDDIDVSRMRLAQLAEAAGSARRVLLEGNHEDRLRKLIWRLPGMAVELAKLRVFVSTMTWPYLLGLDQIGWEYIPTSNQSQAAILPKLIAIHGHQIAGSMVEGGTARKAIQKYGRSAIVGHHHRAAIIARRDHNGQSFGIESGCLCQLDGQMYGRDFNWQQAVTVIEWTKDHKVMSAQQVMIRDGKALWREREITSTTRQK